VPSRPSQPRRRGMGDAPSRQALGPQVGYGEVLRNREFRALFGAETLSIAGDQVAKVAVALLVFARSHSPFLSALTYGITYLPWLVGGPLLSSLADRYRRRSVMVFCDAARALLVLAMATPHLPLPAMFGLLFCITLLEPPFSAARASMLPDVLTGESYVLGSSLNDIARQFGQVIGFAAGGALVASLTTPGALLFDAGTFVVSGVIVRRRVADRPAAAAPGSRRRVLHDAGAGISAVFRNRVLRSLVLLAWSSAALTIVPEGLAVAYTAHHHGGSTAAGLLTAAFPIGAVLGGIATVRLLEPRTRARAMLPMAAWAYVPLLATWSDPPIAVALGLWTLAGTGTAFQLAANKLFVASVPSEWRGRAFGVAQTGILAGQGIALAVGGALADHVPVGTVVAGCGLLGLLATALLALTWPRGSVSEAADVAFAGSSPGRYLPITGEVEEKVPSP